MTASTGRVVLVGGGVASAAAATGLRNGGYDGEIVLISDEPHLPYERPPLSKEFLAGRYAVDDFRINPEHWYADNEVEVRLRTRATALDTAGHRVGLSDGASLSYESLVIATGVRARVLSGFAGEHVHALRSIADSERLASRLVPGTRLAILGAGFIGCEVAAIASARGARVTVFEPESLPLARVLGSEFGTAVKGIHDDHDVEIRTGALISAMTETAAGVELRTAAGDVVTCDELLVGVGSVPNAELAAEAGIEVDGGILTDEYGRTSAPDVYAIGDVAVRFHPAYGRRVRVEHHDTAMRHGANLARNLLGEEVPFTEEHYFWSDQYDHSVKSVGRTTGGESVFRGSVADRSFSVFTLEDGRVRGVVTLDRPRDLMDTRKLLATPHRVSAEQLADDAFPLKSLLPQRVRPQRRTRPSREAVSS